MVKDYLNGLKTKGNFTTGEIANLSGIPEATIRKILSGETADPRFDTVAKLISAMGGSLDEVAVKKKIELEGNSIVTLKEMYDERIRDIKDQVRLLVRNNKILSICTLVLIAFLIGVFIFDVSVGTHGWVRY